MGSNPSLPETFLHLVSPTNGLLPNINAAVSFGVSAADLTRNVDSVMFCVSKALSAPVGSLVAGSRDFVDRARRFRKTVSRGMRQAGVIAAAGIVALRTMVDRLAEDHANARRLAEGLNGIPGLSVNLERVRTNMVLRRCCGTAYRG